jgi:hypothetical protein
MLDKISRFLVILLVVLSTAAYADTQKEITHLLDFVANTACKYERNGTLYGGIEAQAHINKKYQYFIDKINSAEDFIKYSATRSTMSGKKYKILCANMPVQFSSDWLLEELKKYRQSRSGGNSRLPG